MPYQIPVDQARLQFPEYTFIRALTPSEQKAAFHVKNANGQDLCLKIISPSYSLDRLEREITALGRLAHHNVVKLKEYTFSTKDGVPRHFMVEEFVDGSDLAVKIVHGSPISRVEAAKIFSQLADGLEALRLKKIVHRDLKPTNIRVRPDGTPVIIDFGVARHLELPDLTLTIQGAGIGTPLYFAPEQAEDGSSKRNIEHRTDIFALGTMLYEAIVGMHPAMASPTLPLREAICKSNAHLTVVQFQNLPEKWKVLLARLLEKERVMRPHSGGLVAKMLRQLEAI